VLLWRTAGPRHRRGEERAAGAHPREGKTKQASRTRGWAGARSLGAAAIVAGVLDPPPSQLGVADPPPSWPGGARPPSGGRERRQPRASCSRSAPRGGDGEADAARRRAARARRAAGEEQHERVEPPGEEICVLLIAFAVGQG
jgi:hypothetical protein